MKLSRWTDQINLCENRKWENPNTSLQPSTEQSWTVRSLTGRWKALKWRTDMKLCHLQEEAENKLDTAANNKTDNSSFQIHPNTLLAQIWDIVRNHKHGVQKVRPPVAEFSRIW
jgi:hypothetical protein